MAQTPPAYTETIADGTTTQFQLSFDYMRRADVFVTVDDHPRGFDWVTAQVIQLTPAPSAGSLVRIYRSTPAYRPSYEFQLGAPFLPRYIDANFTQAIFVLQEGVDQLTDVSTRLDSMEQLLHDYQIQAGYEFLGNYSDGPWTFTKYNQVVYRNGEWWRLRGHVLLPYTTSNWATDAPMFVGVGDATLRYELAQPGGVRLVAGAGWFADTLDDLRNIPPGSLTVEQPVQVYAHGLYKWRPDNLEDACSTDTLGLTFIAPAGQSGSTGAWVLQPDSANPGSRPTMVDRALAITAHSEHYLVGAGPGELAVGSGQGGGRGAAFTLRLDDDGMLLLRGGVTGNMVQSGVYTDAQELVGDFVTSPTNSTGNYATGVGATFQLPFEGDGLVFNHHADDRGGVWEFNVDEGAHVVEVSTWSEVAGLSSSTVVTGLDKGLHTCTATFLGEDPEHPTTNPRGWLIMPRASGYHTGIGVEADSPLIVQPTGQRRGMLSPNSIPEFALAVRPTTPSLPGGWVPQHGVEGAGACRNITRRIVADGTELDPTLSALSTTAQAIRRLAVVQSYTAYNHNDLSGSYPLWDGVLTHTYADGIMTVSHRLVFRRDVFCNAGYLYMFPSDSRYANELRTSEGHSMPVASEMLRDIPLPYTLSAAFLNKATGDAVAYAASLAGGDTSSYWEPGAVFLQERPLSTVCKLYLQSFRDATIPAGAVYTTYASFTLVANNPGVAVL